MLDVLVIGGGNAALCAALTAREAWVRRLARKLPLRTPRLVGALQFHWGKPPPAAEPRTTMRMVSTPLSAASPDPSHGGGWGYTFAQA